MRPSGENVPSSVPGILNILRNAIITKAVRFSWWTLEESASECDIQDSEVFSFTEGPLLVYLKTGEVIGFSSDESKNSIVVWLEKDIEGNVHEEDVENDEELFPISNDDPKYSGGLWNSIIGNKIEKIILIKQNPQNVNYEELPNEVGMQLLMENGKEFVLSHQLCGRSSNFSVSSKNELSTDMLGRLSYIEI